MAKRRSEAADLAKLIRDADPSLVADLMRRAEDLLSGPELEELDRQLQAMRPLWRPFVNPEDPTTPTPQRQAYESPADVLLYGGSAGGGKGQPLDAGVLTPWGYGQMGELRVGSLISNPDGSVQTVIGIYPLGHRQLYRVSFHDGSSTEVTDDHIWLAWRSKESSKRNGKRLSGEEGSRLWTTEEVARRLSAGNRFRIPITAPVRFTDTARYPRRPVHPYLIGVILGDGSVTEKYVRIVSADPPIIDRIRTMVPRLVGPYSYGDRAPEYRIAEPNSIRPYLANWGLVGLKSGDKYIPDPYLLGSIEERWELLRGLMDTDGWADQDGDIYFTTTSERLRDDVIFLARSLGAFVTRTDKFPRCQYGAGQPAWCLRMKFSDGSMAFSLDRKRSLAGRKPQSMGRSITAIEPTRIAEAQCIRVSNPNGLYLTDDFIVTHNSDLLLGTAITAHRRSMLFRRNMVDLRGLIDRGDEILAPVGVRHMSGKRSGWIMRDQRRIVETGGCNNLGDEIRFQGRAHDLKGFDEVTHFVESQFRYLSGWLRSRDPRQRCRIIAASNPPTADEGLWIIRYWAPWLDRGHPNPALPGELRWFAVVDGKDVERESGEPFSWKGERIEPKSRTFIPSRVEDNPFYMASGYRSQLQSLPEPLRSQLLKGDFQAGMRDAPMQVCPSAWVDAAIERWRLGERPKKALMDTLGVDVARGGDDHTILTPRYGSWIGEQIAFPGRETDDGPKVAALVVQHVRDQAVIVIDVIGVGSSPTDFLRSLGAQVEAVKGSEGTEERDRTGMIGFNNLRSRNWWRIREALDPSGPDPIAIPPDPELRADLVAPRFSVTTQGIKVEAKVDLVKRLGRSPDRGDSLANALIPVLKRSVAAMLAPPVTAGSEEYDPHEW